MQDDKAALRQEEKEGKSSGNEENYNVRILICDAMCLKFQRS